MRVAVVSPYALDAPGGVQDQVVRLVRWLREAEHDAWAVAPGGGGPEGTRHIGRWRSVRANRSKAPIALNPRVVSRTAAAVADAAVIPSPDDEAGEVPKAFVVLKPGAAATGEDIMAFVADRVAPYKKVRRVEFIDMIPKVPSGKILRRELVRREREAIAQAG